MSLKLGEHGRFVCQWPMAGKTPIIDTGIPWGGSSVVTLRACISIRERRLPAQGAHHEGLVVCCLG